MFAAVLTGHLCLDSKKLAQVLSSRHPCSFDVFATVVMFWSDS
jgi:hypothetical protein